MMKGRARASNRETSPKRPLTMTVKQAVQVLGKERAEEICRLAVEDGAVLETMARLRFAALLHLATLDVEATR